MRGRGSCDSFLRVREQRFRYVEGAETVLSAEAAEYIFAAAPTGRASPTASSWWRCTRHRRPGSADGERNIAALAVEVGFAHHSHFTARFHSVFDVTPAQAREMLTKRKLNDLRTLLESAPAA
jgi:AraC-like DNA-binding protein